MPPPWPKPPRWLGTSWAAIICFLFVFPSSSWLSYLHIGFYIFSTFLLTGASSSKGRNEMLMTSSLCQDWVHLLLRLITNIISLKLRRPTRGWFTSSCSINCSYIFHRLIHDALVWAATRLTPGYAVSGAVVVICLRHCLVCRNGAGDLQLGQKYVVTISSLLVF